MPESAASLLAILPSVDESKPLHRRIEHLEASLARRDIEIDELRRTLDSYQSSLPGRIGRLLAKIYDRFFPLHSRRRVIAAKWLGFCNTLAKSWCGRDFVQVTEFEARDRLAITTIEYRRWIRRYEPSNHQLRLQRSSKLAVQPVFTLQLVANSLDSFIEQTIRSVAVQTYSNWRLSIVVRPPLSQEMQRQLERVVEADARIQIVTDSLNRIETPETGFWVRLEPGDRLAPFALYELARTFNEDPTTDFLYSDEDFLDEVGHRVEPQFKPNWSPESLRSYNYIGKLAAYRHDLLDRLNGFQLINHEYSAYDVALRAGEKAKSIQHVPKILVHNRRCPPSSNHEAGSRALKEHLERSDEPARVESGLRPGTYRIHYQPRRRPLVSVLIPNRDSVDMLSRCFATLARSTYTRYEVLILENFSQEAETHAYYSWLKRQGRVQVLNWTQSFNYAAVNNFGAAHARGELLLFLNNDVEALTPDWLEILVAHALRPGIGAVGAKLLFADNSIQHAGIVVGMGGVASHAHARFPGIADGYLGRLQLTHNCAAVTGACMMVPARVFVDVGGFDERFVLAYNDVDLCLRILAGGHRVVCTPDAQLYHFESKTRGSDDTPAKLTRFGREYRLFRRIWADFLRKGDPYFNPHLSLNRTDFALRD